MNQKKQEREKLKHYLQHNYNIDDETLNLFLTFYKKDITDKHTLYKKNTYKLPRLDMDFTDYNLPYEDEVSYIDDDVKLFDNLPDLEFEKEMIEDFNTFKTICIQDKMLDLYSNIKIDDFYRLFAPNYNPVF